MKCKYKTGLLTLQDCDIENAVPCGECGRPVCPDHSRQDQDRTVCLECFMNRMPDQPYTGTDNVLHNALRRRSMYHSGFRPFYFGHGPRYGNDDYDYFDRRQQAGERDDDEEIEPKDFQDS